MLTLWENLVRADIKAKCLFSSVITILSNHRLTFCFYFPLKPNHASLYASKKSVVEDVLFSLSQRCKDIMNENQNDAKCTSYTDQNNSCSWLLILGEAVCNVVCNLYKQDDWPVRVGWAFLSLLKTGDGGDSLDSRLVQSDGHSLTTATQGQCSTSLTAGKSLIRQWEPKDQVTKY